MPDTRRTEAALAALLPDNITGDISPQDLRDLLTSVHSERVVQSGAFASEPASGRLTGDLYLPNDSFYAERWNGTLWEAWGPIFPMTKPVDGDFAWINQGGASIVTTNGGIFLRGPATSGTSERVRKKAAPAPPYTITAAFLPAVLSFDFQSCGLLFRQSSDGKLVTFELAGTTQAANSTTGLILGVNKFTSPTVFSAGYTARSAHAIGTKPVFLRIADNNTNRICSYSADGQNWITFHTIGRTDFLTADEVGFFVADSTNTYEVGMTLLSWKQA